MEAVRRGIIAALAFNSTIQPMFAFDRKHYFYKDQPNGFQVTQHRRKRSSFFRFLFSLCLNIKMHYIEAHTN